MRKGLKGAKSARIPLKAKKLRKSVKKYEKACKKYKKVRKVLKFANSIRYKKAFATEELFWGLQFFFS